MADSFDRFSEQARQVLTAAQSEARRHGQHAIDGEHVLLGLLAPPGNVAFRALIALGVQPERLRSAVEARMVRGAAADTGEIGLTERAKRAIERSVEEARRLNHGFIRPEHLLLGLLRVEEGIAAEVLRELGVRHEEALARVVAILAAGDSAQPNRPWFGYAPNATSQPPPPELRAALEQLAQLQEQERAVRARIDRMTQGSAPDPARVPPGPGPAAWGAAEPRIFERFTERARHVLTLAQEEARRFNHNYIGTEHLLLGLTREKEGAAARVLSYLGVQVPQVRSAIEHIIGRGQTTMMGQIGLTPRSHKALALAEDEARRLAHDAIGDEHLLLGLLREGEGIAAGVLESLGARLDKVRALVLQERGSGGGGAPSRSAAAPPRPDADASLQQRSLGTLLQVIPIVQQQVRAQATLVAIALERYDNGFAIGWRVRLSSGQGGHPLCECTAEDELGTRYRATTHGGSGDGGTPDDHAWRFAHLFSPALNPEARSLTVECIPIASPHTADLGPGTWRLVVEIPRLPEGEGSGARA